MDPEEYKRLLGENQEALESIATEEEIRAMQQDILETARKQAEQIVENAKKDAKKIVADGKKDIKIKGEAVYQENLDKGYADGLKQAEKEGDQIRLEAQEILVKAEESKIEIVKSLEPELIKFVLDITENILTDSYKFNEDIIKFLVNKGLSNIKIMQNIKIYVSKPNYIILNTEANSHILDFDLKKEGITILEDETMTETDCIIETDFGSINCGIGEQFNALKEALCNMLK